MPRPERTGTGDPTLLLFPTDIERRRFEDQGDLPPGLALPALCGFGPVAAAARTAELLARLRPRRVLLLGIAGAYDTDAHPIATACAFRRAALDGVGAGEGDAFQGPPALGFPQWPGEDGAAPRVEDELALVAPPATEHLAVADTLVTTCAASASEAEAARRLARRPGAAAEDMEAFAVGFACALAGTPLTVVRGVSNRVGDRDPRHWRIPQALAAARRAALELLELSDWSATP